MGPLEAEIELGAAIVAGDWHFIGDGIITNDCTVLFEFLVRRPDASEVMLGSFMQFFAKRTEVGPDQFDAQAFEMDFTGPAVPHVVGSELVLRMSAPTATTFECYAPNGDGHFANGRIPSLDLPE